MKKEELFEILGEIDENSIEEAANYRGKRKVLRWRRLGALAACLLVVVLVRFAVSGLYHGNGDNYSGEDPGKTGGASLEPGKTGGLLLADALYPEPVAEGMSAQDFAQSEECEQWWEEYSEDLEKSEGYRMGMNPYYQSLMDKMLISRDENTICSPLNTFVAFAMLAEVSEGNTRQQLLEMLKVEDIETLRRQIAALWKSNYVDTPVLKSLLANSLWLKDSMSYHQDTLKRMAEDYHASSFSGKPGSGEMDKALQQWTDENTGGLLKEYTKDMKLDPATVLALVSTIYYKAAWTDEFRSGNNTEEIFHGTKVDTRVEMMHKTDYLDVCRTDRYTSVGLPLTDSGNMYFYLPGEGVEVNELAGDPDILDGTVYGSGEGWSTPQVNLSLPKFKVSGKTDLSGIIRDLGVTDVFDPSLADFSPLTDEGKDLYLSAAEHAAMVEIDEKGVTGAAYTELLVAEGAMMPQETLDIVIDRPFLFVITGRDGAVLFSGIVRNL